MGKTRVGIAMRHINEQQRKIREHEARIEVLRQAGHLSEVELDLQQRLLARLKAFERALEYS